MHVPSYSKYKSCTRTRTVCIQYSYNPSKVTIDTNLFMKKNEGTNEGTYVYTYVYRCTRVLPDGNRISIGYITLYFTFVRRYFPYFRIPY